MNLASKSAIKNLLRKHQIQPSKRLGQNFLIDKRVIRKIIWTANPQPDDIILEIGPGTGVLTQELAKKTKEIIAIEKDPRMIEILKETLKDFKNVKIIQEDILKIQNANLKIQNSDSKFKIIGNLPFYLTAPVIRKFLESSDGKPKEMVFVVQKEVSQRICSKPPKTNLLAVSVQFYAKPKIISYISKKSFWPQPKVDSAIIKITPHIKRADKLFNEKFFQVLKAGFSQPRKQILNNLSKMLKLEKEKVRSWLLKEGFQPSQRAETLKVKDWIKLTRSLSYNLIK